jgi:alkanesulfonate monooxygenase SsuD/methylene tetrahydromethanopterin reductase-like flavin-dependent oxidoreductase (luciferase family)
VLLAFIAARTTRIRLGHAVTLTPYRFNHPIRVAERVAVLDILSNGRVSWGSGKSSSHTEQGSFQVDRAELDSQWREALEIIPRMWRSDVFEWKGQHFDIPPTPVIPKPVQQPHPPIYAACSRPESVVIAGSLGVGSLNFSAGTDEQLRAKVQSYREAIATSRVTSRRLNDQFCCTPTALVLDDDRKACEHGFRGARFFGEGLATYFLSPQRVVGELDVNRNPLTSSELATAMAARSVPNGNLVSVTGDPSAAAESVSRFQAAGVDELILVMQLGTVPNELVMESIRTFGEKVMPRFA